MAHLCSSKNHLVVGSCSEVKIFSLDAGECILSYSHVFDKEIKDGKNSNISSRVEDMAMSNDGNDICTLFSDKSLICWDIKAKVKREIKVKRRSTAVTFDPSGGCLFVADKSGDLYKYKTEGDENASGRDEIEPILGHVSMLLAVAVTTDERCIVTADRDEKIRVSLLDRPYVIESFCMGHSDFVCSLVAVPSKDVERGHFLLSGSGDGTLCMWEAGTGKQVEQFSFLDSDQESHDKVTEDDSGHSGKRFIPSLLCCSADGSMISAASSQNGSCDVFIFNINWEKPSFKHAYTIGISNCHRIDGVSFTPSENHSNLLHVISTSESGKLLLTSYDCQASCYKAVVSNVLDTINSHISDIPVEFDEKYEGLFKTRTDGSVYTSYLQKKQERLMQKAKRDDGLDKEHEPKRPKSDIVAKS